jgi:hypothetical protein
LIHERGEELGFTRPAGAPPPPPRRKNVRRRFFPFNGEIP